MYFKHVSMLLIVDLKTKARSERQTYFKLRESYGTKLGVESGSREV
jgi:hypothetical protein